MSQTAAMTCPGISYQLELETLARVVNSLLRLPVLQAAIDGQGVALGKLLLAGDALRAGRLVQPFSITQPNDYSYWLVYPASAVSSRPDVAVFRAWLLNEAKRCSKEIEI